MADKFTQIKVSLIRDKGLTPHEKAVLFVLLSYGNCEKIYLSQSTIAKQGNMKRDTVQRIIRNLKKKKYISTKKQGGRQTLEYILLTKALTDKKRTATDTVRKGYGLKAEGVTDETDTSNISISNISRDIKEEIPDCLDREVWDSWVAYRKEKKKTLTESTIKKQLSFLEKNKDDHVEIINQSIMNGWIGLFALKEKKKEDKPYSAEAQKIIDGMFGGKEYEA